MRYVLDNYTGVVKVVDEETLKVLNKRNHVNGVRMVKPRYEFLGEVNPNFAN